MDKDSLLMVNETFQKIWENKNKETEEHINFLKERLVKEQVKNDKLGIENDRLKKENKSLLEFKNQEEENRKFFNLEHDPYVNANNILGQFICLCDEVPDIKEKGVTFAPTDFEDLFYYYKCWCKKSAYPVPDKKKTKMDLLRWQRDSKYSLQIGKKRGENCKNGTYTAPRFNLHYSDE